MPFVSVGDLFFSDSRESLRKKLNEGFRAGVKEFEGIKDYYDLFKKSDLMVAYDKDDNINAFEFYKGDVIFNGISLLKEPYINLIEIFSKNDPGLVVNGTTVTSNKLGIGLNAPYAGTEDEDAFVESVIVFRKGYYDVLL